MRVENSCNGSSSYELFFSQASKYKANGWNDLRGVEDGIQEFLDCIISELD